MLFAAISDGRELYALLLRRGFNKLPAETAFDAEISVRHAVVKRRSHANNLVVLGMHREIAAHAAVGADGVSLRLPQLVPRALLAHVILALEHQSAGGTHANAVATVHASRLGQRDIELGSNVRGKSAARHGDGESILRIHAAGFHALVAENALGVIADVEIVV